MQSNKFCSYKVPAGLLIMFLEKALTLLHMETHLNDVSLNLLDLLRLLRPSTTLPCAFLEG